MKRHPVTFGEYCEFLDDAGGDGGGAADVVPVAEVVGPLCAREGGSGRFQPVVSSAMRGSESAPLRDLDSLRRTPVFGVARAAAEAYAAWRSACEDRPFRLPTSEEWELAARGVDRRPYPWGYRFDPALCHLRESLPVPDMAPVGTFAADCSVYGARDLAGCIQELTASWHDESLQLVAVRGGGWLSGALTARCAWRGLASPQQRNAQLGFRLVAPSAPSAAPPAPPAWRS
jgi:formylglycine-generating enzyme required for sulfatase activity